MRGARRGSERPARAGPIHPPPNRGQSELLLPSPWGWCHRRATAGVRDASLGTRGTAGGGRWGRGEDSGDGRRGSLCVRKENLAKEKRTQLSASGRERAPGWRRCPEASGGERGTPGTNPARRGHPAQSHLNPFPTTPAGATATGRAGFVPPPCRPASPQPGLEKGMEPRNKSAPGGRGNGRGKALRRALF